MVFVTDPVVPGSRPVEPVTGPEERIVRHPQLHKAGLHPIAARLHVPPSTTDLAIPAELAARTVDP
jgi:hypothetical protein